MNESRDLYSCGESGQGQCHVALTYMASANRCALPGQFVQPTTYFVCF
jgi:hypothetical protein